MDEELEQSLRLRYPALYRDYGGDPKKTCMSWGFSCNDGWYLLLEDLSFKISEVDKKGRVVADQVKEKFGGLRFYYHINDYHYYQLFPWSWWLKIPYKIRPYLTKIRQFFYKRFDERISDIVHEAESKSYFICELCGEPGKSQTINYWIKTLCDRCAKEIENNK